MKKTIIILSILLLIAIIFLTIILILDKRSGNQEDLTINGADQYQPSNELEKVKSHHLYNAVNNCINNYLQKIYYAKHIDIVENESDPQTPEEIKEDIYNMLYKPYINEHNINIDNILTYVYNIENSRVINITDIGVIDGERIQTYYVCGKIENSEQVYLIVYIDDYNATFAIRPLSGQYENIESIKVTRGIEDISYNVSNKIPYSETTDQTVCRQYLIDYKQKLLYDVEQAYNLLDKEYKEKRFQNFTNFQEYLVDSADIINKINLSDYQVNVEDGYTEYICKDMYENYYIFHVTSVLEYTVELDMYTISEKLDQAYAGYNDREKAAFNIERFFQMINARDYRNAYKTLDSTFKSQKFGTYDKFKQYVQQTFYTVNDVSYTNYESTQGLHIYEVTIKDKNNSGAETITKNFIVKLLDETDFEMSFSI